ncbi:MAG: hypothetical protein WDZ27_07055 [Waddliaceae bacterium]
MRYTVNFFAGIILLTIALFHLLRLFFPIQFSIEGFEVPIWISLIVFLITGTLSAFLFQQK